MDADQQDMVRIEHGEAQVTVQQAVYSLEAVMAAAHRLTDRCFVQISKPNESTIRAVLKPRDSLGNVEVLARQFLNELLDQQLRHQIGVQTEPIRRLIIAQAFSKTNLFEPALDHGDAETDPLAIRCPDVRK